MHSHEVADGLLHRNKIKESVWIETMRRNSFKTTATLAFIVFCVGCTEVRDIYYSDDIKITDGVEVPHRTLNGKLLISELLGVSYMEVVGNYLLAFTPKLNNLFHIYDANGKYITEIGIKGNGPNDFVNCKPTGQSCVNKGVCNIWINDVSSAELKRIDLNESIRMGRCIIDKRLPVIPMSANSFYMNDLVAMQEVLTENNYKWVSSSNGRILTEDPCYKIKMSSPYSCYSNISRIDECENLIVSAMHYINQINFYNYKTGKRFSACVGSITASQNILDKETGLSKWVYYADLQVTDKNIYALYLNQDYKDAYEKKKKVELHVFGKDGTLHEILSFDQYIIGISVDMSHGILYGLSYDDCIYAYDIRNI